MAAAFVTAFGLTTVGTASDRRGPRLSAGSGYGGGYGYGFGYGGGFTAASAPVVFARPGFGYGGPRYAVGYRGGFYGPGFRGLYGPRRRRRELRDRLLRVRRPS